MARPRPAPGPDETDTPVAPTPLRQETQRSPAQHLDPPQTDPGPLRRRLFFNRPQAPSRCDGYQGQG